jgi:radical SAM protein with 4Fe4S-binding SPASM domain
MNQRYFIFEITTNCNHHCLYCYNIWKNGFVQPKSELRFSEIIRLFNKLEAETPYQGITITGGEPLLHPAIFETVNFLTQKGPSVALATNGSKLTPQICQNLAAAGLAHVEISLPAITSDRYTQLSGKDHLAEVKAAILSARKTGLKAIVTVVNTRLNQQQNGEIIDLSFAFGANAVALNRFVPRPHQSSLNQQLLPTAAELKAVLVAANQKAHAYPLPIILSIPIEDCVFPHANYPDLRFGTCACGQDKWVIDPAGNLRTCEQNPQILGNLFEQKFTELARRPEVSEFKNQTFSPTCHTCHKPLTCGGGCRFI